MRALTIAATGMNAQNTNVEVIANNIANINTTGFKRAKRRIHRPSLRDAADAGRLEPWQSRSTIPEGAQLGLGVTNRGDPQPCRRRANSLNTGNTVRPRASLVTDGFRSPGPTGRSTVLFPLRRLQHERDKVRSSTLDGYALITPPIVIPANTTAVTISQSGIVSATVAGADHPDVQIGQLTIANFANESGLDASGRTTCSRRSPASGTAVDGGAWRPRLCHGDAGVPRKSSNVDPVKEISDLISAQRAYEMNSKVIQAADQMGETLAKGIR